MLSLLRNEVLTLTGFSTLDLSNNIRMEILMCRNNQLSSLDLSGNRALKYIDCGRNLLSSLDLSNNINLGKIWQSIPDISLDSMPTLCKVCVWEMPFPPEGLKIEITDSPNQFFTTECSRKDFSH
jgi:hypothetical protein